MILYYYQFSLINLQITIDYQYDDFFITEIDFVSFSKKNLLRRRDAKLRLLINKIENYFDAYFYHRKIIAPPNFKLKGTAFQRKIWQRLILIPFGETTTYQDLALQSGYNLNYARAVGNVCNKNPIPIIIPCHRVIGKNKKLIGFSSGLEIKKWLLEHEGCKI
jgi:methylated-DNA-[protein]-cysteine S-methyltransferase